MGFILSKIIEFFTKNRNNFKIIIGQESIRNVWDVYYMNTDAVVYVIDSQDDEYFEESKSQFHKLILNPNLKNATILIFANKQDLPGAKDVNKLIQDYEFFKIKEHIWHIQACSALKGEGLVTGIKWLSEQLTFRGKNNFPVNPYLMNDEENKNKDINDSENKDISITVNESKDNISNNNNSLKETNKVGEIKEIVNSNENNINNKFDDNKNTNDK